MLIAVADNGSFTRAGEQLHVSQSAISRKIDLLEIELGEKLFQRGNKSLRRTPAGETVLRYARKIFQDLRNASLEVAELARLQRGQLRIGAGVTACIYMLPSVMEGFKRLYPKIELRVVTAPSDAIITQLRDHIVDLGVLVLPVVCPDLKTTPICSEEMVIITSLSHPALSKRKSIRARELANYPLILFPKGTNTRKVLDKFFADEKIVPQLSMEAENVAIMKPFVKANLGICIVPLPSVVDELKREELHYLRIRDHKLTREIGVVHERCEPTPRLFSEVIRLFKGTDMPSAKTFQKR